MVTITHGNLQAHIPDQPLIEKEFYLSKDGPFDPVFRNGDSTWALATPGTYCQGLSYVSYCADFNLSTLVATAQFAYINALFHTDELDSGLTWWQEQIDAGKAAEFLKMREELRASVGQTTSIVAY